VAHPINRQKENIMTEHRKDFREIIGSGNPEAHDYAAGLAQDGAAPKLVHTDKAPVNPKIVNVAFLKCGSCLYAQKFDRADLADCFGNPPSVHVLGVGKDVIGRPAVRCETFVPRVHKERPACALYKRKDDFMTTWNS
jgi:hypothetical protein